MNGLSLFTGSGIGELAFKHIFADYGYRTIGYVEIDKYCRSIIRARIRDGILDDAPVFDDIREFNRRYASLYAGRVDWLSGGFPCQPFSVAGRRLGEADERNMWPATMDAISIIRPGHCFLENVSALLDSAYFGTIVGDLAAIGYPGEWDCVPASFVGALHVRRRIWIYANADGLRCEGFWRASAGTWSKQQLERLVQYQLQLAVPAGRSGRMVDGVAYRKHRLKATGNGWVPQVVRRILSVK